MSEKPLIKLNGKLAIDAPILFKKLSLSFENKITNDAPTKNNHLYQTGGVSPSTNCPVTKKSPQINNIQPISLMALIEFIN